MPIAYEKGAAVLRMVEAWVGEEAFQKGVNAYIEKFKYGNARGGGLLGHDDDEHGQAGRSRDGRLRRSAGRADGRSAITCADGRGAATVAQDAPAGRRQRATPRRRPAGTSGLHQDS